MCGATSNDSYIIRTGMVTIDDIWTLYVGPVYDKRLLSRGTDDERRLAAVVDLHDWYETL
jgi:hypothetical protein